MNDIIATGTFQKLYKHKIKSHQPRCVIERIDSAIEALHESPDPKSLGEMKKGELDGTYAINLGYDSRLLYSVENESGIVVVKLLRVCNHKRVYSSR